MCILYSNFYGKCFMTCRLLSLSFERCTCSFCYSQVKFVFSLYLSCLGFITFTFSRLNAKLHQITTLARVFAWWVER